ncbi:MAG: VPDSG-CTERM sorting domain-containing protein [Verrucomicrobiales bacterium]|nr:VPDSG-CTERM sorting domain-containing protein [Verrucomicrobiales bacterium]
MNFTIRSCAAGVLLSLMPHSADAGVVGAAQANGNGTYTYSYTVDNTGGNFDIFAWSLEFDIPAGQIDWNQIDQAAGGDVVVPNADWIAQGGVPTLGRLSAQDFVSLSPFSDVLIGGTLSGFSFVSAFPPSQNVIAFAFGASGESASWTTVGPGTRPSGVPDSGATWVLFATGVLGVAGRLLLGGVRRGA